MDIQPTEEDVLAQALAEFDADTGVDRPSLKPKETDAPPAGGKKETEAKVEEEEEDKDEGDEYDKITDPAVLRERLRSKDKGYTQKEQAIKTGEMLAAAIDPKNPKHKEGIAEVMRLIGLDSEKKEEETKVDTSDFQDPEFPDDEDGQYAKEFYELNVKPLVAHATQGLKAELAALKAEINALKGDLDEPLNLFKSSKKESEFDRMVEKEAKKALDLFEVREHGRKATEDDFRAAMKMEYTVKGEPMKPVDALQAYMRNKAPKETEKSERPPRVPRSTESRSAPGPKFEEDPGAYTKAFVQAELDALQKTG